jgi:protein disulfide-isomerase
LEKEKAKKRRRRLLIQRTAHPDAEKAQNEQLAARFQVQGFPTLVVLDPDAKPSGTLGYMRGGPEPFINQLTSLLTKQP